MSINFTHRSILFSILTLFVLSFFPSTAAAQFGPVEVRTTKFTVRPIRGPWHYMDAIRGATMDISLSIAFDSEGEQLCKYCSVTIDGQKYEGVASVANTGPWGSEEYTCTFHPAPGVKAEVKDDGTMKLTGTAPGDDFSMFFSSSFLMMDPPTTSSELESHVEYVNQCIAGGTYPLAIQ